jgi:predicted DNA-binding transcriptional regulator AlpA
MSTTIRTGRRCLADFTADTLSVEEAGEVVGLSRASAYSAVRRGEIPSS